MEAASKQNQCPLTQKDVQDIFNLMDAYNKGVNLSITLLKEEHIEPIEKMLREITRRIQKIEETMAEHRGELSGLEVEISELETKIDLATGGVTK
jgi:chromosome segregation ATPase